MIAIIFAEMIYRLSPTQFQGKPAMVSLENPSFTQCGA
jgi:hypothetical protein